MIALVIVTNNIYPITITAEGTQWSFQNTEENFEAWDLNLLSLGAAQI